ncbi:acyl-CoA dehydrogenase family protein [Oceaniovalibus sp. ACAM 378]|uniref:acyl-CoA dehydrogenase family protein n=1 Tax=Oceaniovalibus sp. ACAM 378 TaxID=2599923 RepID=UPI0011D5D820|nr:acyl-CoA dehydrogenase family protein [Oceaniovalibus sp. ACAM 378]TYB89534.1 acyl-CoA dehydrogenase family protein [Oceaniovalibus sp. ACAM 378]
MDFAPSKRQRELQRKAGEAAGQLHPLPDVQTRDFWTQAADQGWLSCVDETGEGDALTAVLIHEALGRAGVSRSALFAMGAHLFGVAMTLRAFGKAPADAYLADLTAGKAVGALALTEPNGMSDAANLGTLAKKTDDGWLLTGRKTFVSNGSFADVLLVNARHPEARTSAFSTSLFAVPSKTPGLRTSVIDGPIGLKGSPMADVMLDDVRVGPEALVGRRGQGVVATLTAMRAERSCILAGFVGAAERDLQAVLRHLSGTAREHQALGLALAEASAKLEIARWTLYRGAWSVDHGTDGIRTPALTKLVVARTLAELAQTLQELAAGAGWRDQMGLATAVADTMGILTASGTAMVQLRAIATSLDR